MLILLAVVSFATFCNGFPSETRIVNGTNAEPGEIPYIISLRYNQSHTCGGSILNENWILTAAHCVYERDEDPTIFSVQFGNTHISLDEPSTTVEQIIYHEHFVYGSGFINDVAILKLKSSLLLNRNVSPISLPTAFNSTPEGADATLSGWGLPYSNGSVMEDLQKVSLKIYTDAECEKTHVEDGPTNRFYHVCAGVPEGGMGQCNGDSGGPLVVNGIQVGIVSWSTKPCAVEGYPGVFTKVATYVDWIKNKIGNDVQQAQS